MLILEIALGIVLSVVILSYWRIILSFGILGIIFVTVISILGFGSYMIYENYESISFYILIIGIFLICAFLLIALSHLIEFITKPISIITLKKWNLSCGEIAAILFVLSITAIGIYFIFQAIISIGHNNYVFILTLGAVVTCTSAVASFLCFKDIKDARGKRALSIDDNGVKHD